LVVKHNHIGYISLVIKSFAHKGLKKYYLTGSVAGIQANHESKIQLILSVLENAETINDVNLPVFRLHKLSGNRSDIWSVWVNGNWRITFKFFEGYAEIINYEDYH